MWILLSITAILYIGMVSFYMGQYEYKPYLFVDSDPLLHFYL